jgi:hypothetical protein
MIDPVAIVEEYLTAVVAAPATGTLTGTITATATSLALGGGEGASFPSAQGIPIAIGTEQMIVTRSTDALTVAAGIRGRFGTTAAAHSNGVTVSRLNFYLLAGGYVYNKRVPQGYKNENPAVVFYVDVDDMQVFASDQASTVIMEVAIQCDCYGGSMNPRDARMVALELQAYMHNKTMEATSEGMINHIDTQTAIQELDNVSLVPGQAVPYCVNTYNATLRSSE